MEYLPEGSFLSATLKSNGMFALTLYARDCPCAKETVGTSNITLSKLIFFSTFTSCIFISSHSFSFHN